MNAYDFFYYDFKPLSLRMSIIKYLYSFRPPSVQAYNVKTLDRPPFPVVGLWFEVVVEAWLEIDVDSDGV